MTRERFRTSRAELAKTAGTRSRRERRLPVALARRLRRMKIIACAQMAIGGGGVAAGLVLVLTAHPAIGALPLIAGAFVLYRGERRLARVDAVARKQLYGAAAGIYGAHGGCGGGGFFGCAAGCVGGSGCGGGDGCGGGN
jgi:hypothetical protein